MNRTHFKAYRGDLLVLATWAEGAMEPMERAVYQERLDRGDFSRVDISHDAPDRPQETLRARL